MEQDETPLEEGFELVSRHLIMERDLNHFGNLFGGALLYWLDESTYLYAIRRSGYPNMVTASIDHVSFTTPGHKGDSLAIYCRTEKVGRSSLRIQTRAFVENPGTHGVTQLISCLFTFVALKNDKPFRLFESKGYQKRIKTQEPRDPPSS